MPRPRGKPTFILPGGHNSVRLWALCTPLSSSSAYAPLSPAPLPRHAFFFYPASRVIFSLRKKRTGTVSLMGANFFFFFFFVQSDSWLFLEAFSKIFSKAWIRECCIPIDRSSSFAAFEPRECIPGVGRFFQSCKKFAHWIFSGLFHLILQLEAYLNLESIASNF